MFLFISQIFKAQYGRKHKTVDALINEERQKVAAPAHVEDFSRLRLQVTKLEKELEKMELKLQTQSCLTDEDAMLHSKVKRVLPVTKRL